MSEIHPALLPNGLSDLLPPEAGREAAAIHILMQEFAAFGYRQVKPPLVEFEESLLTAGPGQALAPNTFRLMDPVSQRMMGVRADTTAQIARIAASRLSQKKRPLRLSYAVDVLRVNGTQLRPARQFCQVGCEFIGAFSFMNDAEVALLALKSLSAIGLKDLTIDLSLPALAGHIFDAEKTAKEDRAEIIGFLKKRDREALEKCQDRSVPFFVALLEATGAAEKAVSCLRKMHFSGAAAEDVPSLICVYKSLKEAVETYGLKADITIDPLEHRGLSYETGVSFTLYAASVRGEVGGGGRYRLGMKKAGGEDDTATGFTLYMDSILPALPKTEAEKIKTVSVEADWKEIKALQDQGWKVFREEG